MRVRGVRARVRATSERITVLWNLVPLMLACSSIVHSTENASPDGGRARGEGCSVGGRAKGKGLG